LGAGEYLIPLLRQRMNCRFALSASMARLLLMRDAEEMVRGYEAMHPVSQDELERSDKKQKRGTKLGKRDQVIEEGAKVKQIPATNIEVLIPHRRRTESPQPTIEEEGTTARADLE
jgi:hypothetical protein